MKLDKDGKPIHPTIHQMPIYYIFQDKDGWHRTDERLTDDLNKSFVMRLYRMKVEELNGLSFYPQFREPNEEEMKNLDSFRIPAWRITSDGYVVARCREVECQHRSWHRDCRRISDELCLRNQLIMLEWSTERKMWIQSLKN